MREQWQQDFRYLGFRRFLPEPGLSAWVDCFWSIGEGAPFPQGSFETTYPDGGCSLSVILDGPHRGARFEFNRRTERHLFLAGARCISARLLPGALFHLFGVSPSQLPSGADACQVLPAPARARLRHLLATMTGLSVSPAIARLEQWLGQEAMRLCGLPDTGPVLALLRAPEVRVGEVSGRLGISSRTLERRIMQQVGLSPVFYQLCLRMKSARLQLARPDAPLSQVALSCGYYDQAHFTHAFRRFVGDTPAEYRKRKLSQNYKAGP